MKYLISFLIFSYSTIIFSQNLNQEEISIIEKYLTSCQNVTDIKKIYIFKDKFPEIFKKLPEINPINPDNDPKIGSQFSKERLHPIYGNVKKHNGVDIVAKLNTPVYATAEGIVKKSKFFNGAAGHSVQIDHSYGFTTKYFHLNIFIVKNNEFVRKGQIIGFLGSTGGSTGAHLHYEILKNNKHIDPVYFIKYLKNR